MLLGLAIRLQNRLSEVRNENGATAIEYGLLAALIAAVIITFVALLGDELADVFDEIWQAIRDR